MLIKIVKLPSHIWKLNIKKAKKEFEAQEKEARKKDKTKPKEKFDEVNFMRENKFNVCLVKELLVSFLNSSLASMN